MGFSICHHTIAFTFFQLLDLLCGEGRPVPLQLALEPHPERLLLVARVGVVVGVAVRGGFVQSAASPDAVANAASRRRAVLAGNVVAEACKRRLY